MSEIVAPEGPPPTEAPGRSNRTALLLLAGVAAIAVLFLLSRLVLGGDDGPEGVSAPPRVPRTTTTTTTAAPVAVVPPRSGRDPFAPVPVSGSKPVASPATDGGPFQKRF